MSLSETAELVAELNLRGDFASKASKAQLALRGMTKEGGRFRSEMVRVKTGLTQTGKVAAGLAAGGIALLAYNVKQGIESLAELEDVQNATNAAIKSTRGIAGLTAKEIGDLAGKYEDLTTVDDKVIQSGENVLLTFTRIKKDAFEPALAAALDLSVGMDQDLKSSVVQVGKALNDPIRGITALTRVGVTFSDEQKKVITRLVKTGETAKAQKLILRELNTEFGGRAQAAAKGYRGEMARLDDAVEGVQQTLAEALLPAMGHVARRVSTFLKADKVKLQVRSISRTLAGLFEGEEIELKTGVTIKGPSAFDKAFGKVEEAFDSIKTLPWDTVRSSLDMTLSIGREALAIFNGLPEPVKAGLITALAANKITGGALASLGKTAIDLALKAVSVINTGAVTMTAASVVVNGGAGTGGGVGVGPNPKAPANGGGVTSLFGGGLAGLLGAVALGSFGSQSDTIDVNDPRVAGFMQRYLPGIQPTIDRLRTTGDARGQRLQEIAQGQNFQTKLQLALQAKQAADDAATARAAARTAALEAKAEAHGRLAAHQLLRAVPLIGGVQDRISDLNLTVRRKDLSVRNTVVVNTSVSAVTHEGAATAVRATNRFIAS